jgi:hypothetical protein
MDSIQGNSMPLKKPLPALLPDRLRPIPRSFAWIDHRLRSEGFLKRLRPEDVGLYLFLALAADRNGLSCWRLDRIERDLPCFDRQTLWDARSRLAQLNLIAYRPWREGSPDGCYQLLALDRPPEIQPQESLSPQLTALLESIGRHIENR